MLLGVEIVIAIFLVISFGVVAGNQGYTIQRGLLAVLMAMTLTIYLMTSGLTLNNPCFAAKLEQNQTNSIIRLVENKNHICPKHDKIRNNQLIKRKYKCSTKRQM